MSEINQYSFNTAQELLKICKDKNLKISQVMKKLESLESGLSIEEVENKMSNYLDAMVESVERARKFHLKSIGGFLGGELRQVLTTLDTKFNLMGTLTTKAMAYAMGVLEVNASMGVIVAAPTAGAAGIIPGVLTAFSEEFNMTREQQIDFLFHSGAIGTIIMKNATISGAVGGCQAETGSASAMAASAICEYLGADVETSYQAGSFALQNLMGLICDPVLGLVEAPCQMRNASAASNAILSAQMAISGIKSVISFDKTIIAMYKVGKSLPHELRETALGGIAFEYEQGD